MRRWLFSLCPLAALVPQAASAQPDFDEPALEAQSDGPELGLRTGYAIASGRISPEQKLRGLFSFALPVFVDLGYRAGPWFFGGYGQYALGFASETAQSSCKGCTHSWLRLGLQAQYSFVQSATTEVWAGLGAGQQWLYTDIDKLRRESFQALGFEYLLVQFGTGFHIAEGLTLGPFSSFSLGEYTKSIENCLREALCPATRNRVETRLDDSKLHLWFFSGLRATVLP